MNTITIRTDEACEMACVELNGKCIMMGNFWDFHPNCMGIREYGDSKQIWWEHCLRFHLEV